jgi:glycosyltransferase 2 family protein
MKGRLHRNGPKVIGTLTVTGLCIAYIVWKINLGRTAHVLAHANLTYFLAALAIVILAILPMAWRWQRLLAARGIDDDLAWLIRTYFVSYAAGQVLPTSLGGDAARIVRGRRRHPGQGGPFAASVVLERALGGAATLTLAAAGFALAVGRYNVGPYLWIEACFVAATVFGGVVIFSRTARRPLARLAPFLRAVRLEEPLRAAYLGLHAYRRHLGLLGWAFCLTLVVQAFRVLAIWLVGRSVGVELSPRPYYVMGPMLFLVMLVPFTINGVAVREAFFVSFLGKLGVSPDAAFSTGFLFFLLAVVGALPGAAMIAGESISSARLVARARRLSEETAVESHGSGKEIPQSLRTGEDDA